MTSTADAAALRAARSDLAADCSRCRALCCVGPAFTRSADFPVSKPAGLPCPNLGAGHRCGIHDTLLDRGYRGCVGYDCFGAGQRLVAGGVPDPAAHDLLAAVRLLGELAWYLHEVLAHPAATAVHAPARSLLSATTAVLDRPFSSGLLAGADTSDENRRSSAQAHELRAQVAPVLRAASDAVRTAAGGAGPDRAGADLAGQDLRDADLRRGTLRGAVLLGTDLRGADLRTAELLGADTRGADLRGADLRGALFVTRTQLDAARGDAATRLPGWADRPAHWAGTQR